MKRDRIKKKLINKKKRWFLPDALSPKGLLQLVRRFSTVL
jgi:hypothetical protein